MKFCQPHWDYLRAGVELRGMTHLVKSGPEAQAAAVRELEGEKRPGDWDPLMAAHWALAHKVIERIGASQGPAAGLSALGDPTWCPLCEIQRSYDCWSDPKYVAAHGPRPGNALDAHGWADSCLDAMFAHARKEGLLAKPS